MNPSSFKISKYRAEVEAPQNDVQGKEESSVNSENNLQFGDLTNEEGNSEFLVKARMSGSIVGDFTSSDEGSPVKVQLPEVSLEKMDKSESESEVKSIQHKHKSDTYRSVVSSKLSRVNVKSKKLQNLIEDFGSMDDSGLQNQE